jgi:hypothetical protein
LYSDGKGRDLRDVSEVCSLHCDEKKLMEFKFNSPVFVDGVSVDRLCYNGRHVTVYDSVSQRYLVVQEESNGMYLPPSEQFEFDRVCEDAVKMIRSKV